MFKFACRLHRKDPAYSWLVKNAGSREEVSIVLFLKMGHSRLYFRKFRT